MNFTAKDVADLRAKTGCGMMDCKKALTEAEGDVEKATEILREKGLAASVKKASRIAAEGVAYAMVSECGKVGVVIEVNAETDFVAKNAQFIDFVKTCAETVIYENPADVEALLAAKAHGSDMTVDAMLKDKILTIGENIKIRRFVRYEGDCVAYVHGGGRIGVLVRFETENVPAEVLNECGKDVAMQIAALNPAYLDKSTVPAEALDKEKKSSWLRSRTIRRTPRSRRTSSRRWLPAESASSMRTTASCSRHSLRTATSPLSSTLLRKQRRPAAR